MTDRELTVRLATVTGVDPGDLDPLFTLPSKLTEWSVNAGDDPRGALRVSVWTDDRDAAGAVVDQVAPAIRADRDRLIGGELEGLGLAFHRGAPPTFRWWELADDGDALAARVTGCWPEHADAAGALFDLGGGPYTCAAVGVEVAGTRRRATVYAEVRSAAACLRILEHARVPVTRATNLLFKGILGIAPGGRSWPKVWVGRSVGDAGGWKFYYFARGDEARRTDPVLLDAIDAGPALLESWRILGEVYPGPRVQLLGLTLRDDGSAPSWTAYLAGR
jgi:hypothetical protein